MQIYNPTCFQLLFPGYQKHANRHTNRHANGSKKPKKSDANLILIVCYFSKQNVANFTFVCLFFEATHTNKQKKSHIFGISLSSLLPTNTFLCFHVTFPGTRHSNNSMQNYPLFSPFPSFTHSHTHTQRNRYTDRHTQRQTENKKILQTLIIFTTFSNCNKIIEFHI